MTNPPFSHKNKANLLGYACIEAHDRRVYWLSMGLMKSSRASAKYGMPHSRVKKIVTDMSMTYTKVKGVGGKYDYLFEQGEFEKQVMLWLLKPENAPKKLSEADKQIRRDNLVKARKAAKLARDASKSSGKKKASKAQATA